MALGAILAATERGLRVPVVSGGRKKADSGMSVHLDFVSPGAAEFSRLMQEIEPGEFADVPITRPWLVTHDSSGPVRG